MGSTMVPDRIRRMNPQLRIFLIGIVLVGAAGGIFETTFNNFLDDAYRIDAGTRGFLEFPRELPGFLVVVTTGMLAALPETSVAALAALAVGLGMIGTSLWGMHQWTGMMIFMILWSIGTHLLMPVQASISMDLATEASQRGRRLGQVQGAGIASALIGCGIVLLVMRVLKAGYRVTFMAGGCFAIVAAVCFWLMRMPDAHLKRPKFIWRREYWLYYSLSFLFGARKQIFITFGPWVLIKIFNQPPHVFAQLWMVSAVLGTFFQPLLGRVIDRFGERKVLLADAVMIFAVCMGYGLSDLIPNRHLALWMLFACYIGDHLLFGVNMARTTYLSKIAIDPRHLAPTLSLGVTINHAVSMTVPAFGGMLWLAYGYRSVFMAAAGFAVLMFVFSLFVQVGKPPAAD